MKVGLRQRFTLRWAAHADQLHTHLPPATPPEPCQARLMSRVCTTSSVEPLCVRYWSVNWYSNQGGGMVLNTRVS
jgi:hypothetical protein